MTDFFEWVKSDAPEWVKIFLTLCALLAGVAWMLLWMAFNSFTIFIAPFVVGLGVIVRMYMQRGRK